MPSDGEHTNAPQGPAGDLPITPITLSAQETARAATGTLAAAIRLVSGLTLFSRIAGLLRDIVMVRLLGDGAIASAFRAAYTLPNLFRRLFGEGALSAAFLPEYTQLRREEPQTAAELATLTLKLLTLATGWLTLAIELVLIALLVFLPDNEASRHLSFKMMMLMLPMMPMVCITAILGGILQAHGKFGPPAAAPIILNLFQIAAGLVFYLGMTNSATLTAYIVGAAAVLASIVQIVWSLWALKGCVKWSKAGEDAKRHGARVFKRFIPAVLGLGTLQLNTMVDQLIAMWPVWIGPEMFGRPVPLDVKSNAILSYTQQLYQFPLGVFGIAVATAVFPMLSRASADPTEFAAVLRRGLRLSFFIGLPASIGLILVRHDLIFVVYSGGNSGFDADSVARGAAVLLGFAPGVWAYSLNHVLTRAFYAKHNTRTPMRVAMSMVLLNLSLNFTLIWYLREAGLAWATAASAMVQMFVLLVLCVKRLGVQPFDGETTRAFLRIGSAAALMALAVWAAIHWWPDPMGNWKLHAARLAAGVGAGGLVFGLAAFLLRAPEMRWLVQRGGQANGAAGAMSFD